jgi:hypothetical protein
MRAHYFDEEKAPESDIMLKMAIRQGYVPEGCLMNGHVVIALINGGCSTCPECNGPREKCGGKAKRSKP